MQVQALAIPTRSSGSISSCACQMVQVVGEVQVRTMDNGYSFEVSVAVQANVVNAARSYLRSNQATGVGGRGLMTGKYRRRRHKCDRHGAKSCSTMPAYPPRASKDDCRHSTFAGLKLGRSDHTMPFRFLPGDVPPHSSAPAGRAAAPQALIFRWAASEAIPFTRSSDSLLTRASCVPAGAATCHQTLPRSPDNLARRCSPRRARTRSAWRRLPRERAGHPTGRAPDTQADCPLRREPCLQADP